MEIFNTYIKEALRWKGASMKSAQALPSDHKTQLSIMRLTTKSCLDAYLMRIFNIDECTARDVSNALTQRNLPSDMTADLDDFKAEPWHPEQITKNKTGRKMTTANNTNSVEKIEKFARLVESEQKAQYSRDYPYITHRESSWGVSVVVGKKYTKVDVGNSGKYMVDEDGNIFGIKAYGVIHRGHQYGTLDTINEWYWGGYTAIRKPQP